MKGRGKTQEWLAGSLLLAHPVLKDPNFRRTVVLMSAHDEGGAMGVVLSRPVGKRLGELKPEFAQGSLGAVPLFTGGPVQSDRLILVAWEKRDDGFRLHFGIGPERAEELMGDKGVQVRAYLGYSGWTGGQLEGELLRQTWVVTGAPADLFERPPGPELWQSILSAEGATWKLLADEPDEPGTN